MNRQIEDADAAADALHRKMYPEQYKDIQPDPNAPDPAKQADPVPAPVVDENAPSPVAPDPNAVPPAQPAAPTPATPEPDTKEEPDPAENWEQKYKVLQGKYDAEVPRTVAEKKELQSLLNQAIATINQINANRVSDPNGPTNAPEPPLGDIPAIKLEDLTGPELAALKEDYPDIYNALGGVVEKLNEHTTKISQEIKSLKTGQSASVGAVFQSDLGRLVPDWETIREDPEFSIWLNQTERYSGKPYYEMAAQAAKDMDARRLAGFYNGFKESRKIDPDPSVKQDPAPVTPVPPVTPAAPAATDIKNLAPPRSQNTPTPPAEPQNIQGPKITKSFIQKFYQDGVKGVYAGREAEWAQIEAQIHEATRTGKVLPG